MKSMQTDIYRDIQWPTLVVDNFFKNPEEIIEYSKQFEYFPDEIGKWPGLRSPDLYFHDRDKCNSIISKVLSFYFSDYAVVDNYHVNMFFQKIKRFNEDENSSANKGFIHQDGSSTLFAGVIYLNEEANINNGTNTYDKVSNEIDTMNHKTIKNELYKENLETEYLDKFMDLQEKSFKEDTIVKNKFNRLVLFDSMQYHTANSYYSPNEEDERLTIVFFVNQLDMANDRHPYMRAHDLDI